MEERGPGSSEKESYMFFQTRKIDAALAVQVSGESNEIRLGSMVEPVG